MCNATSGKWLSFIVVLALAGIGAGGEFGPWDEPVNLGSPPNLSTTNEQGPALSTDNLTLYFGSNRTGGSGGNDLWFSTRDSVDDAFGEPVNLGSTVNSSAGDNSPTLSVDGLLMFFTSNRSGGAGSNDIYMCSRTDATDDLSWGAPVRLGSDVNTSEGEFSPFVTGFKQGEAELYFERGPNNLSTHIHVVTIDGEGNTSGPAEAVTEVNCTDGFDMRATVRFDGREMYLASNRDGRGGNVDIFVSTRQNRNHPWSTPVPVDELNSSFHEIQPYLCRDGRTIVFIRGQQVANEIMISHRDLAEDEGDDEDGDDGGEE